MGTEMSCSLTTVPRNGSQVVPLEVVPRHSAKIFPQAPTKSSVRTSAYVREEGTGT